MSTITELSEPMSAAQLWHRFGEGIGAQHLPEPSSITRSPHRQRMLVTLLDEDLAALRVWASWLGAGGITTRDGISHLYTRAVAQWHDWEIEVVLVEPRRNTS